MYFRIVYPFFRKIKYIFIVYIFWLAKRSCSGLCTYYSAMYYTVHIEDTYKKHKHREYVVYIEGYVRDIRPFVIRRGGSLIYVEYLLVCCVIHPPRLRHPPRRTYSPSRGEVCDTYFVVYTPFAVYSGVDPRSLCIYSLLCIIYKNVCTVI
jgi:hypothetical protein